MGKIIVMTFLALGWGFYMMSGGADFKPAQASVTVAESKPDMPAPDVEVTRASAVTLDLAPSITAPEQPVTTVEAAVTSTPAFDLRAVAGSRVNMREGPGTDYGVIMTLDSGTQAEVIEVNPAGWARVRLTGTNQTGWMAERLLAPL